MVRRKTLTSLRATTSNDKFGEDAMSETHFKKYHDQRKVNVFIDEQGKSWTTTVASQAAARGHEWDQPGGFAPTRSANATQPFSTGESYFADVVQAMDQARQSIFIAGWQVNWDVELVPGRRLIDVLKDALDRQPALRVYVMPWMSPKIGLDTGDFGTMLAIFQLNAGRPQMRAFCCPAGLQNDFTGVEETFFSHHQKQVVIDNTIAYAGGIDLAYGRRDDASFSLNHGWRKGPEIYNPGVPPQVGLGPAAMAQYVSEADLLKTTLSAGWLADTQRVTSTAGRLAGRSPLGQAVDAGWSWLKEPMPSWLQQPISLISTPLTQALSQAREAAEAQILQKIQSGAIKPSDVTAPISAVGEFCKSTYLALLGLAWITTKPNTELMRRGAQATPAAKAVHRSDQPRQPWQDVHMRLEGPSAYDLSMNFIRRWNSLQKRYLPAPLYDKVCIPPELIPKEPAFNAKGPGTAHVRVLRSASLKLQQQERAAMPSLPRPLDEQHDIHDMMVRVILGATHFVYIENQFFQSRFGVPSIDPSSELGQRSKSAALKHMLDESGNRIKAALTLVGKNPQGENLPGNQICWALGQRIEHAVRWGMPFHAYIVLPVHPEGRLDDLAIMGQIHWTMQSLVFGSHSLVNRVRCAIAAKQLCKGKVISQDKWQAALLAARSGQPGLRPYEQITPTEWAPYLTLMNLRNCDIVGGKLRTEQIYVHSKLLIADDCEVIMGSANINDRSLAGHRDSELAVYVQDRAIRKSKTHGHTSDVRVFGHDLRTALWRKHLALDIKDNAVVKPASGLTSLIEQPAAPTTILAIQQHARNNQLAYEKTFGFIPRNKQLGSLRIASSIWPTANRDPDKRSLDISAYAKLMPFSEDFWMDEPAKQLPQGIQGFFTALPVEWTMGENNHPDMNKVLLTQIEPTGQGSARHQASLGAASNKA